MATNRKPWWLLLVVWGMVSAFAVAADTRPSTTRPGDKSQTKALKPEELQQLTAPVALYPDSLLAQILMASTYPLEIVQAERWMGENKTAKGAALTSALEKKDWDPSVKSLVNFPQVLTMMSRQLEWTTKLGDAFIADQAAVMSAVQALRARAQAQGSLKSNEQQKVTVAPATQPRVASAQESSGTAAAASPPAPTQIIQIESSSPDVVYVPAYDPGVVYGYWPYAYYPPYRPAPAPPGSNLISFGAGVAIGAAWGYAWGGCNWHHGDVDVDVNRNLNVNQNINRQNYANRQSSISRQGAASTFQHDPAHRRGAAYRDTATARQYSPSASADAARARENYRGRAEAGRQDIARGGANQFTSARPAGASLNTGNVSSAGGSIRSGGTAAGGGNVPRLDVPQRSSPNGTPAAARTNDPGARRSGSYSPPPAQYRENAFPGMNSGGASARASSSRGQASRSAPARSAPAAVPRAGGGGRAGGGRR